MKARSRELLDRSIACMIAAIDIYNKPDFYYRSESFTILSVNSWELLLKAKWLVDNGNRLKSLYQEENHGQKIRLRYKRTRSGNFRTHGLDFLAKKLTEQKALDNTTCQNIEALIELRDTSVHFYHRSDALTDIVQELAMACLKNFVATIQEWFNEDLSKFNFYLMPLSFMAPPPVVEAIHLNLAEANFLKFIKRLESSESDPSERFSVLVNVEVKFVRSKAKNKPSFYITNSPDAIPIRVTDEQILERYPWDYKELEYLRARYSDFKVDGKYHSTRKGLESDGRFAHVRRLDPHNPKSSRKPFFNANIAVEFDKQYTKK